MRARALGLLPLVAVAAWGCSEHRFEPPDREAQVARADSLFSPALFDSVTWASDSARALEGNVVFSTYCRNCHGPLGAGGTEYARSRDLEVPSLVSPEWPLAEHRDSILQLIFVGHAAGMPTWGVAGISAREMDAVVFYVTQVLRPEVLGGD
ncbi:MAG TPA: cytochrome c [Longimicrobiales bacterium]|nr:cytochrome c [Longimicrobiales bacterium]